MPLLQHTIINRNTQLAVWQIEENDGFFLAKVPLQRNITHPQKRLQHLAGRYLLQYLYPSFPYEQILIAPTRKPFLADEAIHFSISHCSNFAAAIVSTEQRVGIDIEVPTIKVLKIAHKFLHPTELNYLQQQSTGSQFEKAATLLWSAKEAIYKWWGRGEVDFSEMIQIAPFSLQKSGTLVAMFCKDNATKELVLQYELHPQLVLCRVCTEKNHLFI